VSWRLAIVIVGRRLGSTLALHVDLPHRRQSRW
jgi:hypothetical protein